MTERKKILWLTSWYPNKNDRFDGDFIQRHARAAAIYHDIHVIFVTETGIDQPLEEEWNFMTGLTEQVIYFRELKGWFRKGRKHLVWKSLMEGAVDKYILQNGHPHLIHVHIPWKAGLVALSLKKKYGIRYVVTEHWGIYSDAAVDPFKRKPLYIQKMIRNIFLEASAISAVSHYLAGDIERATGAGVGMLIPNVVDTSLFFPGDKKYSKFTFLHVSNMAPLKRVDVILEAFKQLLENGREARLVLVGNRTDEYPNLAGSLGMLNQSVFFMGEIPYKEVAQEMRRSHCLVIFSDFETFSCVTAEAMCSGLPVLGRNTGALPELIKEGVGILAEAPTIEVLARRMAEMVDSYDVFDRQEIPSRASALYSYSAVAALFDKFYGSVGTHS